MLVIIFILFVLFAFPKPALAQIPLLHQLFYAYLPGLVFEPSISQTSNSSLLTPSPSPVNSKTITIVVIGDSMIDTLGPKIQSLETALAKHYPNHKFKILNYGVGSSTIESGLKRLSESYTYKDQDYPSIYSLSPDIIILESFAYNNFGNTQSGIDKHWLNLGAITTNIKNNLPNTKVVIAATIAPNSVVFANNIPNMNFSSLEKIEKTSTIKLYLKNAVNFATSQNYPLADAYTPSLINNDGNKDLINPADNIHPSPAGATFFSDILAKTIFDNNLVD